MNTKDIYEALKPVTATHRLRVEHSIQDVGTREFESVHAYVFERDTSEIIASFRIDLRGFGEARTFNTEAAIADLRRQLAENTPATRIEKLRAEIARLEGSVSGDASAAACEEILIETSAADRAEGNY